MSETAQRVKATHILVN